MSINPFASPVASVIPKTAVFTPYQQLLIGCVDWAESSKKVAVANAGIGCSEPWERIAKTSAQEEADKVIAEVQKQVSKLRQFNVPQPHQGVFQEVSWLLGYKPFYVKAFILDSTLSLSICNGVLIDLVFEYYKPKEPSEEEIVDKMSMEHYFPTNQFARNFRLSIVLQNLKDGYYATRPKKTAEISVQTDEESATTG